MSTYIYIHTLYIYIHTSAQVSCPTLLPNCMSSHVYKLCGKLLSVELRIVLVISSKKREDFCLESQLGNNSPCVTWACQGLGQRVSGKSHGEEGEAARITSGDQSSYMFRASPCFYTQHKSGCHPRAPCHPHCRCYRQGEKPEAAHWTSGSQALGTDWMEKGKEGLRVFFVDGQIASTVLAQQAGQCHQPSVLPATVWTGLGDSGHEPRPPAWLNC